VAGILKKRKARGTATGCLLIRTLASLRKVDDYPVYVIEYRGGYLFEHFSKIGIEENMYPRLMDAAYPDTCTCFAALNSEGDAILAGMGRHYDQVYTFELVMENSGAR